MSVWPPQGTDVSIRPPRVPTLAKGPHLSGYSKGEHLVLGKSIAHDMKSGAEGAHFLGALLLTFSFDKHSVSMATLYNLVFHNKIHPKDSYLSFSDLFD